MDRAGERKLHRGFNSGKCLSIDGGNWSKQRRGGGSLPSEVWKLLRESKKREQRRTYLVFLEKFAINIPYPHLCWLVDFLNQLLPIRFTHVNTYGILHDKEVHEKGKRSSWNGNTLMIEA